MQAMSYLLLVPALALALHDVALGSSTTTTTAAAEVLTTPGGVSVSIDRTTAAFFVSIDEQGWLYSATDAARFVNGSTTHSVADGTLKLLSVSAARNAMDATFGATKRVDIEWATASSPTKACLTGALVALQNVNFAPGLVFEMGLPLGSLIPSGGSSSSVGTAWPIFNTSAGSLDFATMALANQNTASSVWGPSSAKESAAGTGGMNGGAPLVLWPHHVAPGPAPGPPGPGPATKAKCRVVGTSTKVTPVPSHDHQYDSYTPSTVGTSYDKHAGTYCETTPAHDWVYTGDVDKATCQSKCDETTCACFGVYVGKKTKVATEDAAITRALALAPLTNFMSAGASTVHGTSAWGLFASVEVVEAGFKHATALVGGHGVSRTLGALGDLLLKKGNKTRTILIDHPTDKSLTSLGYWTDNGAWYHYLCSECCGGGGSQGTCPCPSECAGNKTMEDTMLAVKADWKLKHIPAVYFMFDSWWYPKDGDPGANATQHPWPIRDQSGVLEWVPEKHVFPSGLTNWLDKPTFLHNRCFATDTVYLEDSRFKNSFACNEELCIPLDVELFKHIMEVVQPWSPFLYEQDWISKASTADFTYNSTWRGSQWLTAMNNAAMFHDMTIQYSMTRGAVILHSTQLQAVTQIRGSGDYTAGSSSWQIGGTSLFYWSLGIVASKDTFFTTVHQPGCPKPGEYNCTEANVEINIITATLSHGPVGPGDRHTMTDPVLTLRSCNAAGAILRPRAPLTPLDGVFSSSTFAKNKALLPWGATVGSKRNSADAFVVLHTDVAPNHQVNVTVQELAALPGASDDQHAYPPRFVAALIANGSPSRLHADQRWGGASSLSSSLAVVEAGSPLRLDVGDGLKPPREGAHAYEYWLLAPIDTTSGWALLGEMEKIVPLASKRVAAVHSSSTVANAADSAATAALMATIVGVEGESVVITAVDSNAMTIHEATCVFTAKKISAMFSCTTAGACTCA